LHIIYGLAEAVTIRLSYSFYSTEQAGLLVPESHWHLLLTTLQRTQPELMATVHGRLFNLLIEQKG